MRCGSSLFSDEAPATRQEVLKPRGGARVEHFQVSLRLGIGESGRGDGMKSRERAIRVAVALTVLVAPHMFWRFMGLSFLVPGVVSPSLPADFAVPAAYGDLIAGLLAIVTTIALSQRAPWAIPAAWVFNVWGAADLILALLQGVRTNMDPGALGAAFFIPTALVPPGLMTHALVFRLLAQTGRQLADGSSGRV